jgi:hypothetical protein
MQDIQHFLSSLDPWLDRFQRRIEQNDLDRSAVQYLPKAGA